MLPVCYVCGVVLLVNIAYPVHHNHYTDHFMFFFMKKKKKKKNLYTFCSINSSHEK